MLNFTCNICSAAVSNCPIERIDREVPSCPKCSSTVRFRSIAHLLSMALFGITYPVSRFPVRKDIIGVGLSDWYIMADLLQSKCGFTNTFIHQDPYLDITKPNGYAGTADFLISSEVFEHIPPPVQRAFDGAYAVLRPGGHLILSVPYSLDDQTIEHFPDLHEYRVVKLGDEHILVNRDASGNLSVRSGLVFHDGQGDTLEMRVFCERAVMHHLLEAGFVETQVMRADAPEWGILHKNPWSLPISARRPK